MMITNGGNRIQPDVFRRMIETMRHGVILTDENRRFIYVNAAFTAITGYTLDELSGQTPSILRSGQHDESFYRQLWHEVHTKGYWQGEIWNRRKNGELLAEWQNIYALLDENGAVQHYAAIFTDISENKRLESSLKQDVYIDSLTGVYNRRYFNERIEQKMNEFARRNQSIALMMVDIDYFKRYNDRYGHIQGDKCLIQVASALAACLRKGERLARFGGEEFVLFLPGLDEQGLLAATNRFLNSARQLELPHEDSPILDTVTVSVGAALMTPDQSLSVTALLERADQALYRAKEEGRNRAITVIA
ncbi:GGDEF domain-containing protein [Paenibacillus methanolicus]|uniref:PAS domain S-box-containing protein/diguanylate cyclase (GGDEF)-like protein n=1 Tax=Paenibacillus methanolicus TaxID=582686 RepID=A0A5S5CHP7_9BACL|nr:diguanylate cyclase [Paenibacillus methanolicus]TYP79319.1 PAS domain S-box-containing protein/diguanylate cyclase (GGDEF)-like protein [Paenibacillus methanolicus]